jgi:hypothetical protein
LVYNLCLVRWHYYSNIGSSYLCLELTFTYSSKECMFGFFWFATSLRCRLKWIQFNSIWSRCFQLNSNIGSCYLCLELTFTFTYTSKEFVFGFSVCYTPFLIFSCLTRPNAPLPPPLECLVASAALPLIHFNVFSFSLMMSTLGRRGRSKAPRLVTFILHLILPIGQLCQLSRLITFTLHLILPIGHLRQLCY